MWFEESFPAGLGVRFDFRELNRWMRNDFCRRLTEAPVQPNKQLTDAEGDGGVSRDDDGLVSTFGISAVVDLKLQKTENCVK